MVIFLKIILGGATFCAIASLKMLNGFDLLENKNKLIQWLIMR
jgi:prenyltransferase beta subunit